MLRFPYRVWFFFASANVFLFIITFSSSSQNLIIDRSHFRSYTVLPCDTAVNPAVRDKTFLAIGAGLSSYSAPEIVVLTAGVLPQLAQHIFIETGADVYLIRERLKYDGIVVSADLALNFNVKAIHDRLNMFFGGGAALYIPNICYLARSACKNQL